jgi:DNA-binding NarL/FixJ family response regulator
VHPLTWTHRQGKADPLDTTTQRTDNDLVGRLTARELEVLRLVAEGCDNQTIATRLVLDRATIRTHVEAVLTKLDAPSRLHAVVRAVRLGLCG